jgi:hypothetical protein
MFYHNFKPLLNQIPTRSEEMPFKNFIYLISLLLFAVLICLGCSNSTEPTSNDSSFEKILGGLESMGCVHPPQTPPAGLITVSMGDQGLEFWPYTAENFSGSPQDPINLIFYGQADPRQIMAALMSLDGDRTAFGMPDQPPFNQTWHDAIGFVQAGYGSDYGWVGGDIQLACGDYGPIRFHIRLFRMGAWTVGNAHFEVLIEGTSDHQVLSWEMAEQFVIADFMRSGLLDPDVPIIPVGQINDSPFRTIPLYIYNALPVELRGLIGGPLGDVTEDVPIATDGNAVILNLAGAVPVVPDKRVDEFVINYDIAMPRPFCAASEYDFVYVTGPVHLKQTVTVSQQGVYDMFFQAFGTLYVTPIDPSTGQPTGETYTAEVRERYDSHLSDFRSRSASMLFQIMMPGMEDASWRYKRLMVKSDGMDGYLEMEHCGGE